MDVTAYTCITGGYDRLIVQPRDTGTTYVCFTDRPDALRGKGWEIRPLVNPMDVVDPTLVARYHKVMCYDAFPACRTSIYIDGNVRLTAPPSRIAREFRAAGHAIAVQNHSRRTTVALELEACIAASKLVGPAIERSRQMLAWQRSTGFPDESGLSASFFVVRDPGSAPLRRAMDDWWHLIRTASHRDQLSLEYCLWQADLTPGRFAEKPDKGDYAVRLKHGASRPSLKFHLKRLRERLAPT